MVDTPGGIGVGRFGGDETAGPIHLRNRTLEYKRRVHETSAIYTYRVLPFPKFFLMVCVEKIAHA